MLILILIVAAVIFVGYAVYAYGNTFTGESIPKRVWGSVVMAGAAIGAAIQAWLHGVTAP